MHRAHTECCLQLARRLFVKLCALKVAELYLLLSQVLSLPYNSRSAHIYVLCVIAQYKFNRDTLRSILPLHLQGQEVQYLVLELHLLSFLGTDEISFSFRNPSLTFNCFQLAYSLQ